MIIRTCDISYVLSQIISIDFKFFLIRIIKTCEIFYVFLTQCLYVHILNGECPPGLDKMCEISYDFRKVISRACLFLLFLIGVNWKYVLTITDILIFNTFFH